MKHCPSNNSYTQLNHLTEDCEYPIYFVCTPQNNWNKNKDHNSTEYNSVAVNETRVKKKKRTEKTVKISSWRRRCTRIQHHCASVRQALLRREWENVRVEMITILRVKRVFYINLFLAFEMPQRNNGSSRSDAVIFNATTLQRIWIIRNGFCVSGWPVHAHCCTATYTLSVVAFYAVRSVDT